MGTKNSPGEFDCYANAEDDEPMFVLLARDNLAAATVRDWAEIYKLNKEHKGHFAERQRAKYDEALRCADAMEAWRVAQDSP